MSQKKISIKPPINYALPEKFPNCCGSHKFIHDDCKKWLTKSYKHKKKHNPKFRFENKQIAQIANKVARYCHNTEQHIRAIKGNEDWFDDFKEYVECCEFSLARTDADVIYIHHVKNIIYGEVDLEHKEEMLKHIQELKEQREQKAPNSSVKALERVYHSWLGMFPFDMPYFKGMKEQMHKSLPIIESVKRKNRYTNLMEANLYSEEGLLNMLYDLTDGILRNVNLDAFHDKGEKIVHDPIAVALIKSRTKMKRKKPISSDGRFKELIRQWLEDEREWLAEMKPYLQELPKLEPKDEIKLSLQEVALLYAINDDYIENDKANEIAEKFGHTSGEKLLRFRNQLGTATDRTNCNGLTNAKIDNLIKRYNKLKDRIKPEKIKKWEDELNVIEAKKSGEL